ncbi:MAG: cupredoxin domain-containing protein [Candidatus Paceibacterota bacterium]
MKATLISILVALVLIGGALFFTSDSRTSQSQNSDQNAAANGNNVTVVDGKQIIEITARGGYQPRKSLAQAGLPTVIRFNTSGSFDCSSSVRIPSLNVSKLLPATGNTDIDIGSPQAGTLQGMCGMGMYRFEVAFE